MAILNENDRNQYTGDTIKTSFIYDFKINDSSHIAVYLDGVLQSSGYTVTGVLVEGGGTVDFAVAPGSGVIVTFIRAVPTTQPTIYPTIGKFPSSAHEGALDYIVMQNQQRKEVNDRTLRWPVNIEGNAVDMPDPSLAANQGKAVFISADGLSLEMREILATDLANPLIAIGQLLTHSGSAVSVLNPGATGKILTIVAGVPSWADPDIPVLPQEELLINGSMIVNQRGSSIAAAPNTQIVCDGWSYNRVGAMRHTVAVSTDVPTLAQAGVNLMQSLKLTTTTLDATLAASDLCWLQQIIEAGRAAQYWGREFTVSFWLKTSVAGDYAFSIENGNQSAWYVHKFTVTDALWNRYSFTVPATAEAMDETGINGRGMAVTITLDSGSDYKTASIDSWETTSVQLASTTQVNFSATTGKTFLITGVQVDLDPDAQPLRIKSRSETLNECYPRYQASYEHGVEIGTNTEIGSESGSCPMAAWLTQTRFPVKMLAIPTFHIYHPDTGIAEQGRDSTGSIATVVISDQSQSGAKLAFTVGAADRGVEWHWAAVAEPS